MGASQVAGAPYLAAATVTPAIVSKANRAFEGDGPGSAPSGKLGPATVTSMRYDQKERMRRFDALKSYNFRVVSKIEHEVQTRWIEDLAQTVRIPITKKRASHVASSIKGTTTNQETGQPMPFRYGHSPELPFTTFDNPWIADGFTAKDVTLMLYVMPAFGNSFVLIPMTDDEVNAYWEQKQSPQVLEAQNRVLDSDFVSETLAMQEEAMAGNGFALPPLPQ
jgi:hypothetical protein